jgi:hypothetical protein
MKKMNTKLVNSLMLAAVLSFLVTAGFAQTGGQVSETECDGWLTKGRLFLKEENYKLATDYFFHVDNKCKEKLSKNDFENLIYSAKFAINEAESPYQKESLLGGLLWVWQRAEAKGFYDVSDDLVRGYYYLQRNKPDYVRADFFMKRGIEREGTNLNEVYITIYYYNIYTLWYIEKDAAKKAGLKQRLIREHSSLSRLVKAANFSEGTQKTLDQYLEVID